MEGFDGLMGARNTRASQLPFHSEISLGNGMHKESQTVYCYICNRLFSVGKDDFGTRRMTSICKLFGRYKDLEKKFQQFRAH